MKSIKLTIKLLYLSIILCIFSSKSSKLHLKFNNKLRSNYKIENNLEFQNNIKNKNISNSNLFKNQYTDPFKELNLDELQPDKVLSEIEKSNELNQSIINGSLFVNSISDISNFIKKSKLSDEELLQSLSRYILQDNIDLKKEGIIYDNLGYDGLLIDFKSNSIDSTRFNALPIDSYDRVAIRTKSCVYLFLKKKYPNSRNIYQFNTISNVTKEDQHVNNNWMSFNANVISNIGVKIDLKVCLPLDESQLPFVSFLDNENKCLEKEILSENALNVNKEYLNQLKNNLFVDRIYSNRDKKIYTYNFDVNNNLHEQKENYKFRQISEKNININNNNNNYYNSLLNTFSKEKLISIILQLSNKDTSNLKKLLQNSI